MRMNRNQIINSIDEGWIGDFPEDRAQRREIAEKLLERYIKKGWIDQDNNGFFFVVEEIPEDEWLDILDEAANEVLGNHP